VILGWIEGRHPQRETPAGLVGILAGLGAALAGGLALYWVAPISGGGLVGAVLVGIPALAILLGVALAILAFADLGSAIEVTGPILRLRAFGGDDRTRYYAASDDGSSRAIRALRVKPRLYTGLGQGDLVTARVTRNLGCVRWIVDGPEPATASD
jgi:hypothetical protein